MHSSVTTASPGRSTNAPGQICSGLPGQLCALCGGSIARQTSDTLVLSFWMQSQNAAPPGNESSSLNAAMPYVPLGFEIEPMSA